LPQSFEGLLKVGFFLGLIILLVFTISYTRLILVEVRF